MALVINLENNSYSMYLIIFGNNNNHAIYGVFAHHLLHTDSISSAFVLLIINTIWYPPYKLLPSICAFRGLKIFPLKGNSNVQYNKMLFWHSTMFGISNSLCIMNSFKILRMFVF